MRRVLVSTLAAGLTVCLWSGPAFAGSVTVRNDRDDSASVLDINRVGTDTSNRNAFFGIRTWDPFTSTDVKQQNGNWFVFVLDTKRRGRYDKLVYLSYDSNQARYECEVQNRDGGFRRLRGANRADSREIECVIPLRWLDIHKPVQFGVEAYQNRDLKDRAPNNRRYVGL